MNKFLLTAVLVTFGILNTENIQAQTYKGTPIAWTPASEVKVIPGAVQKSFTETLNLAGLLLLDKPKWNRQNGLYTAFFRANGEYGPGSCVIRFKPYGGVVLFGYEADQMPVWEEWE